MKYAVYNTQTGAITAVGSNPDLTMVARHLPAGHAILPGVEAQLHRHEVKMVQGKPALTEMSPARQQARLDQLQCKGLKRPAVVTVDQVIRVLAKKGIQLTQDDFT